MSQPIQALPANLSAASLLDVASQGENAFIEFNSSFQKEVIESLTAFANTQGGAVLIGVSDGGQDVGVSIGDYRSANDSTIFKEFETTQGGVSVTVFKAPAEKKPAHSQSRPMAKQMSVQMV